MIRRQVAVIVGHAQVAQIAKAATTTTPIVFVAGDDPVRVGLVANLNRPGGNVTGVTFIATDVAAKRLGLLHALVPQAAVIAVLLDPNLPDADQELRSVEAASRTIGVRVLVVKAATAPAVAAFGTSTSFNVLVSSVDANDTRVPGLPIVFFADEYNEWAYTREFGRWPTPTWRL